MAIWEPYKMTKRKRTTYGKSPQKISEFLDDCLTNDLSLMSSISTTAMEELLTEYLAEKCATISGDIVSIISGIVEQLQSHMARCAGQSIAEVLGDPKADLGILQQIKDHFKQISRTTDSKAERHVTTAIYFAAIACALVIYNQKISEYSMDTISASFKTISAKPWITKDLKGLYAEAQKVCQRYLDTENQQSHGT
jgi:hypothetical protein